MAKRQGFTEKDLEAMGMIEIAPGQYQKLHTPQPRKERPHPIQKDFKVLREFPDRHLNMPAIAIKYSCTTVFQIEPCAAPRQTGRDAYNPSPRVVRYRAFCDELRRQATEINFTVTERMWIRFYIRIPKGRIKGKHALKENDPCKVKPDADNLYKAFTDALTSKRYDKRTTVGDQHIWDFRATKYYSHFPRIEVQPLQD